jgi:hypothetical protein
MIHFVLLISRQGKVRLTKWYSPYSQKERTKVLIFLVHSLEFFLVWKLRQLCMFQNHLPSLVIGGFRNSYYFIVAAGI